MTRYQGYRYRLQPTKTEDVLLRRFVGCSRFVWNDLVAQNEVRRERGLSHLGYPAMCEYLLYLKEEHGFLRVAHSQSLQQTLRDLAIAYSRAGDPKSSSRRPRFKKKGRPQGIRFPQGFVIDGSVIYLPKIGWVRFRKSRGIEGIPKNVTVSNDGKHWYVTVQTERDVGEPECSATLAVGIDLGVARFAALSDGSFVDGANAFETWRSRLALYQTQMARRVRFSANWRKAKANLCRVQRKIANIRRDMLHKASAAISKNHAIVVMEDLRILNMTASAGPAKKSGGRVRAKSGLNRRILDQGWGEFRRQLDYKLAWAGGMLLLVDARYTSRTCSQCGYISAANRRNQAAFKCRVCNYAANADSNAAVNILKRAGQARIACGGPLSGRPSKQEAQRVARAIRGKVLGATSGSMSNAKQASLAT
jgi:putative transposase